MSRAEVLASVHRENMRRYHAVLPLVAPIIALDPALIAVTVECPFCKLGHRHHRALNDTVPIPCKPEEIGKYRWTYVIVDPFGLVAK